MDTSEVASHLDSDELEQRLVELNQGDILDVAKFPSLYSPDSPSFPDEVGEVPHEEPTMTMEQRLPTGLSVVISQTCDIRRLPSLEPYVLLAPLSSLDPELYEQAIQRLSTRYFAYPAIADREGLENLALDARVVSSLEKAALLSSHIQRIPCPLSDPERDRLRRWLGDRLGRVAYPDEITRQVVQPIEQALKRTYERGAYAPFFESVVYYGVAFTPGREYCSLLILTDPGRRGQNNVNETAVNNARKALQKALNHWAKDSPYTITATVHDATEVPASEMLQHHELRLDLEAMELG